MADQRGMRCVRLAFIQQSFQLARGPVQEEGFDSVGHNSFYHREITGCLGGLFSGIPSSAREPYGGELLWVQIWVQRRWDVQSHSTCDLQVVVAIGIPRCARDFGKDQRLVARKMPKPFIL